jgi:hypothetical protein
LQENSSALGRDSFHLLGFPTISTDDNVKGEIVTVLECQGKDRLPFSEHRFASLRPSLFAGEFEGYRNMSMDKIFIARRGNRSLINSDEVSTFLEKQGFKTCFFEDYPVNEKWSIARDVKIVIAINGAAGGNLVFNRLGQLPGAAPGSGVKMIEIMSPAWMHIGHRDNIVASNGTWCAIRGQITPEILHAVDFSGKEIHPFKPPHNSPFKVDCGTIQMALDYIKETLYTIA